MKLLEASVLTEQMPRMSGKGVALPERTIEVAPTKGEGWIVTVFDNDTNSYDQVMLVLMRATACTSEEAYIEAWEIDHYGKCVVHKAGQNECKHAAEVIATIGIRVEATPEE